MSQIRCEIAPTTAMAEISSYFCTLPRFWIRFGRTLRPGAGCAKFPSMTVTPDALYPDSLYEDDFYAWTQQQAELLRRLPPAGNALDLEHIAKEIEDLGRSDLRAAQSLCEHVIEHFLTLAYTGLEEPADHWRDEIVEWRLQLEKTLTRSIAAKLDLPARYRAALRLIRRLERDVPELTSRLPQACPYTLEQIVSGGGEDWFPAPRGRGP